MTIGFERLGPLPSASCTIPDTPGNHSSRLPWVLSAMLGVAVVVAAAAMHSNQYSPVQEAWANVAVLRPSVHGVTVRHTSAQPQRPAAQGRSASTTGPVLQASPVSQTSAQAPRKFAVQRVLREHTLGVWLALCGAAVAGANLWLSRKRSSDAALARPPLNIIPVHLESVAAVPYGATESHDVPRADNALLVASSCQWACSALAVDEDLSVETIENTLSQLFDDAIKTSFPSLGVPVKPAITPGRDVEKGEYQCNNAMALTKVLKDAGIPDAPRSPKEIGECIVQNLPSSAVIEGANVAPQGFINIKINKDYVQEQLYGMLKDGLQPPRQRKQRVLIDFSSPNIAKEMHVGHLRSTIIGECLSRTFEFCGHDVLRVNHVGDWGTQFGMLIAHLKDNYPDFKTNTPPISDLVAFYKESKARFDADPAFKERAQQEVVALQGGDEENLKAWRLICEVSRVEFEKIYERLEVTVEEKGESFYNPYMPSMVQELIDAKLADVSDGAKVIVSGAQVPLTDLTQADVERLLQSNLLKTPMNEQPALVQCLTDEGFVVDDPEGVQCLKVGSGKKQKLLALTAVDSNMGLETASKIAKGLSEALVKTQKTKQGKQLVVNAGFLDALRATPGLVSSTEEGADSVFVPAFTYPFMIQKRDGGFTYDTTDLAALRYRLDEENVERVIYVTDVGQEPHFMMLFAAAKDVGYFSPQKQRCDHVGFGLVFGPDGKKLKTREGDTIRLADLLDEAPKRSYEESVRREEEKAALAAERGETYEGLTEEELQQNANVIGYGAVKYFDLRQNRTSSYRFSYDEMLSLKGNTAVGLIYAYVRMRSIARKAGVANSDDLLTELEAQHPEGLSVALNTETEWALGLHLMRFSTTIDAMTEELAPNKMTDFLYELVTKFNAFYLQESILKAEDRDDKLLLCEVTAKILKEGLRLLGIGVLEKL